MPTGTVERIQITDAACGSMKEQAEVEVKAGQGIAGDRYYVREGSFSKPNSDKIRDITFIEREALDAASADYDLAITAEDTRRNVVTVGVALNHLVGKSFRIGQAEFMGTELCEPCGHIKKLSGKKGIAKALIHRGGLRARVVSDGAIHPGDSIDW